MGKGWIALDIDGTVVEGLKTVPAPVAETLDKLYTSGWKVLFITGRPFASAEKALTPISFPYYLAAQHGADIVEMPSRKVFEQCYLDSEVLYHAEKAYREEAEEFLVYAGFVKGDFCYYRPHRFSPAYASYFTMMQGLCPQPWQPLQSFDVLQGSRFPLIKCLGDEKTVRKVAEKLRECPGIEVVVIRDMGGDPRNFLALVTDREATKGNALHRILAKAGRAKEERVIAAGDDHNDLSMLREADVRIVIEHAPPEVLAEADIIAERPSKMGLIRALAEATGE